MGTMFTVFDSLTKFYLFDAMTNSIVSINKDNYKALKGYIDGDRGTENMAVLESFQNMGYCRESSIEEIVHYSIDDYASHINNLQMLTLQVTQNCNLRCSYCVYSGNYKNRTHSNLRMSFDVAKKAIDYLFEHSINLEKVSIGFYGGEPLLEFELIKKCVRYVNENYEGKKVLFNITCNGTLLTEEVVEFLYQNSFSIMISLDGPKQIHDRCRKFVNGQGSYETIISRLEYIKREYPDFYRKFSVSTVISPQYDLACIKEYFDTDSAVEFLNARISYQNDNGIIEDLSYDESFLIINRHETFKVFLSMLNLIDKSKASKIFCIRAAYLKRQYKYLKPIKYLPQKCHPGGPCIVGSKRLFVNTDGYLYPCERVSEDSEIMRIGSLSEGIDIEKAKYLTNIGAITKERCSQCWGIIHCKMCASSADGKVALSKELKLLKCNETLDSLIQDIKDICFLKEYGYDFNEEEGGANV
ncbi:Cys-rich peptide radical SAM maturase CcpM [Anaerocolumna aminovalerica]|uniref:Radical SAM core domain-containing protein n=1 Tax=Anaerocolumna aminovalerica TaxID=1527 RepID=A0A1I5BIG8_9FIRM|nr:Cys-rich peptide radical SAM maturase CcpM [Anaerocolumna aminovalerica]MBU5331498.1 Cys-rich peptide radical SAM maturase CcpM [Anaerocolumna aminovalerica]SFN74359.1 uncharacterized protein SAMN04489757_10121 [Anaerocolumna aminovalerica]